MPRLETVTIERDLPMSDPELDEYVEMMLPGKKIVDIQRWPDGMGANVTVEVPPTTLEVMDESIGDS